MSTIHACASGVSEQAVKDTPNISGIIDRAPADLKPWPGNPRTHSDKQQVKLKASIRQFGFTAPVLVDERGDPERPRPSQVRLNLGSQQSPRVLSQASLSQRSAPM